MYYKDEVNGGSTSMRENYEGLGKGKFPLWLLLIIVGVLLLIGLLLVLWMTKGKRRRAGKPGMSFY